MSFLIPIVSPLISRQVIEYDVESSEVAYQQFRSELAEQAMTSQGEYLVHNPCNYGNGQLLANTCIIDSESDPDGTGSRDPIHILKSDLNPGALLGLTYQYMQDPNNVEVGEVSGSSGTPLSNVGAIGEGSVRDLSWSNPAFKPLADYLNRWFFVNTTP